MIRIVIHNKLLYMYSYDYMSALDNIRYFNP